MQRNQTKLNQNIILMIFIMKLENHLTINILRDAMGFMDAFLQIIHGDRIRGHTVFTHGFLELGNAKWLINMMNEILNYDSHVTVVIVDWRGGSAPPYYQAVANIRVVGAIVAHMIIGIALELGIDNLDRFHLIGHSLGSHVCGYAGYFTQRDFGMKIGQITGLDPAKPYFEFTLPIVRLDSSDAQFVDILHTDSATFQEKSFGLKQQIGHADFYPNGGRDQPICKGQYLDGTCNHKNAVELYTESINTKCPFMAISCKSYEDFLKGLCSNCNDDENVCMSFGFHSKLSYNQLKISQQSSMKPLYLLTASSTPFCRVHYKINIKMANNSIHQSDIGTLSIKLITNDNKISEIIYLNEKESKFEVGETYSFFVTSNDVGGPAEKVKIIYNYKFNTIRLKNPEIYVEYILVQSMEYNKSIKICSENRQPLINGFMSEFDKIFCV
ncbi:pancreatic triacylglycerol lipase-like isoform X2 [Chironomus tepperi]|uniref:pancreatic triacylglycerol lipase-like isoform X2 n=1 Tax=Chironomus tepperi TaxID=113505 RepID=UPI00391F7548